MPFSESASEQNRRQRDIHLNPEEGLLEAERIRILLDKYRDKRVLVLATPGSGKSTLLQHLPDCFDMDEVFDTMPEDFKRRVLHYEDPFMISVGGREITKHAEKKFVKDDPESEEFLRATSEELTDYINNNLKILPGNPVFGTNLIDTDVVIYLDLSNEILNSRIDSRNTKTHRHLQRDRVFELKKIIEGKVALAREKGIVVEDFKIEK